MGKAGSAAVRIVRRFRFQDLRAVFGEVHRLAADIVTGHIHLFIISDGYGNRRARLYLLTVQQELNVKEPRKKHALRALRLLRRQRRLRLPAVTLIFFSALQNLPDRQSHAFRQSRLLPEGDADRIVRSLVGQLLLNAFRRRKALLTVDVLPQRAGQVAVFIIAVRAMRMLGASANIVRRFRLSRRQARLIVGMLRQSADQVAVFIIAVFAVRMRFLAADIIRLFRLSRRQARLIVDMLKQSAGQIPGLIIAIRAVRMFS